MKETGISSEFVFPSARQGLTAALKRFGLSRVDRIAVPEWSSHCVISAVSCVGTPIPMTEVIHYDIPVSAVVFYEQWGWPLPPEAKESIKKRFPKKILISDCVDSADFQNPGRSVATFEHESAALFSLSKLLGVKGGGLVRVKDKYEPFEATPLGKELSDVVWTRSGEPLEYHNEIMHFHKSDIPHLHPELSSWLREHDLNATLEVERQKRRRNLGLVLGSGAAADWPGWMSAEFQHGAAPGIVPLLQGHTEETLLACQECFRDECDLETQIYHFNWSGDPCAPQYGRCLAFPIHGLVGNVDEMLRQMKTVL